MNVDPTNDGHKHWTTQLQNKIPRQNIENFFRSKAEEAEFEFAEDDRPSLPNEPLTPSPSVIDTIKLPVNPGLTLQPAL